MIITIPPFLYEIFLISLFISFKFALNLPLTALD
uniref:Uncharacterized protein n=1 Tax=Manihot esculenta TaxID=3983 RepID=A0A2C9UAW9_MANES